MKTNTTIKTEVKAREQIEQVFTAPEGEFHKYVVLRFNGREQVTVFPFAMKHADVFSHMKRECPELEAISAGFFIVEAGSVWVTGNSELLRTFLISYFSPCCRRSDFGRVAGLGSCFVAE